MFRINTYRMSADSKPLTWTLSPLDATLTKNRGEGYQLWLTRNEIGVTVAHPFRVKSLPPTGHNAPPCAGRVGVATH
jgi:hypothetical protein